LHGKQANHASFTGSVFVPCGIYLLNRQHYLLHFHAGNRLLYRNLPQFCAPFVLQIRVIETSLARALQIEAGIKANKKLNSKQ
jgi:hypothetical protein